MDQSQKLKPLSPEGLAQLLQMDHAIMQCTEALLDSLGELCQKGYVSTPDGSTTEVPPETVSVLLRQLIDRENTKSEIDELVALFDDFTYGAFLDLPEEHLEDVGEDLCQEGVDIQNNSQEEATIRARSRYTAACFNNVVFPASSADPLYHKLHDSALKIITDSVAIPPVMCVEQLQVAETLLRNELMERLPFPLSPGGCFCHIDQLNTPYVHERLIKQLETLKKDKEQLFNDSSQAQQLQDDIDELQLELEENEEATRRALQWVEFLWAQNALSGAARERLRGFYRANQAPLPTETIQKDLTELFGLLKSVDWTKKDLQLQDKAILQSEISDNSEAVQCLKRPVWRLQTPRAPSCLASVAGAFAAALWRDPENGEYMTESRAVVNTQVADFPDDDSDEDNETETITQTFNVMQYRCLFNKPLDAAGIVPQVHQCWESSQQSGPVIVSVYAPLRQFQCKTHASRDGSTKCEQCGDVGASVDIPEEKFLACYKIMR